jgi:hypothetical protein
MLLRFGLFEKPAEKKEKKESTGIALFNPFAGGLNLNPFGAKKVETAKAKEKDDIDRLVEYLALILEYDESYFNGLTMAKL